MTALPETRITPWLDVTSSPAWMDSDVAAFRVWTRASAFGWEQRHEWRMRDGLLILDPWARGPASWHPASEAA